MIKILLITLIMLNNANIKTKNILVLCKDFVQELDNTTIYAEKLI